MSSPASRRRQRHRRRTQEKLWAIQALLDARRVDLKAYELVIADMDRRYHDRKLSLITGAQALSMVTELRDHTKTACEQLQAGVAALEIERKKLEPAEMSA